MIRQARFLATGAVAAGFFSVGGGLAHAGPAPTACAAASFTHRAALVVEHADGRVIRLCIGFDSATLTADQVLQASGLELGEINASPYGDAVCQIDSEPPSYPPRCFTEGSFWALFVARGGGAWQLANYGVSSLTVGGGDAVGLRYDSQAGQATAPASPGAVCAVTAASAPTAAASSHTTIARSAPVTAQASTPSTGGPTAGGAAATATPSPQVLNSAPVAHARPPSPPSLDAGVIAAVAGGGLLLGLFVVRLATRRRSPTRANGSG